MESILTIRRLRSPSCAFFRQKFITPGEVAVHNTPDDIWVSFLGKVHNLTPLCEQHHDDPLIKPIIAAAGTDISHWFDPKTSDFRQYVDPETGCIRPYMPHGRILHASPPYPDTTWVNDFSVPWWMNDNNVLGLLTEKTRFIKIINTLTSQEEVVEVCQEETMIDILDRYLGFNAHAESYTWKYHTRCLDMSKTLEQNGIEDDDEEFYRLGMDEDTFLQAVHLYFNDDLTEA